MWKSVLLVLVVFNQTKNGATCALEGFKPNNSAVRPFILNSISDDFESAEIDTDALTLKLTESIKEVRFFNPVGFYHSPYLTGGFKDLDYYLKVNNISSTFTRNEQTRVMMRGLYLYCLDGTRSHYYLQIPVEDKTKPKFTDPEYTFNIDSTWDISERPVSDGQFVIVGDNSYELQHDGESLAFTASPDYVNVKAHKLWVRPNPSTFFYRLDIYLKDNVPLIENETIEIQLSASDKARNVGIAKITVNIS